MQLEAVYCEVKGQCGDHHGGLEALAAAAGKRAEVTQLLQTHVLQSKSRVYNVAADLATSRHTGTY